jgi:hypothetical protein
MADGSVAIAMVNMDIKTKTATVRLDKVEANNFSTSKDLWSKQVSNIQGNSITATVQPHGVAQFRLWK